MSNASDGNAPGQGPGMGPAGPAVRLPETSAGAASVVCAACQSQNPVTMNFCKMCGEPLRGAQPSSAQTTPKRMALPSAFAAVVNPSVGIASTPSPAAVVGSSTPAGAKAPPKAAAAVRNPVVTTTPATAAAAPTAPARPLRSCASCGGSTPTGFSFCQHCGNKLEDLAASPSISESEASAPATVADAGVADTLANGNPLDILPLVKKRAAAARVPWGQLVSVLRDGSDGDRFPLADEAVDIGRTDGTLTFDDRFLAPRHARVERRGPGAVVTPLENVNGVYFRLRANEGTSVIDGIHILIGKEVLRFEVVEPEERAQNAAVQHGVRLFGSPVRSPWARLRQIVQTGVSRDIYHLLAAEVTLGREEGDLRFPDDEFMSRRHARIANLDGRFEVTDLESSNGTFLRVRGERVLRKGDVFRMGDQLFRFEPSA